MADIRKKQEPIPSGDATEQDARPEPCWPALDDIDDETLATLYAEFAEEDRALANSGLAAYAQALTALDQEE